MDGVQRWRRLGLVFAPSGDQEWMASHAAYPTPLVLDDGSVRVFFATRDRANRSSMVSLDLALEDDRFEVLVPPDRPLLAPGVRGAFDDSGITVGSVVRNQGRIFAYYLGWTLGVSVPFRNFIGLAIAEAPGPAFERHSQVPVIDRSTFDPHSLSYPWVMRDGDLWRMWYGSTTEWAPEGTRMVHVLKEATSDDGVAWVASHRIVLAPAGGGEYALSRPVVVRDPDRYRMWYSVRKPEYAIGYAESPDGIAWQRKDHLVGIGPSASGWDSDSVEYPAVFDAGARRYMLYNGNGFGRTGFGLAMLDDGEGP